MQDSRKSDFYMNIKNQLKSGLKLRPLLLIFASLFIVCCIWFYFTLPDVSYLKTENPEKTALMELRIEQASEANKKYHIKQTWIRFGDVPELLKKSIRITEDAAFYDHSGLDWTEFWESVKILGPIRKKSLRVSENLEQVSNILSEGIRLLLLTS